MSPQNKLDQWFRQNLRKRYRRGLLTKSQIADVEKKLPGWQWEYDPPRAPKPVRRVNKSVADWVSIAKRLTKDNGGVLPKRLWLNENGYSGLTGALQKDPEAFAKIKRRVQAVPIETVVKEAETLAKKNGGLLPRLKSLRSSGHNNIEYAIKKHPEAFAHIPWMPKQMRKTWKLKTQSGHSAPITPK